MKIKIGSIVKLVMIVSLLTLLTQLGGVVYLLHRLLVARLSSVWAWQKKWWGRGLQFCGLYLLACFALTPPLARHFGRVPLPFYATSQAPMQPASLLSCLSNRHYVRPLLRNTAIAVAQQMRQQNADFILIYLDANFPFWDGFPLWPHRSHDDGKKLDIAFVYQNELGTLAHGTPSMLGYGVVEPPLKGESDQPALCEKKGHWQYSLLQRMTLGIWRKSYRFDLRRTQQLIRLLAHQKSVGKIFIEPHLRQRMRLNKLKKVRFHGCAAVRHDDHIHLQL
ncbi:MAG: hypothetical protein AAGD05_10645 [Bacteroidota bacterium]